MALSLEGAAIFETYRRDPDLVRRYALDDVIEVDGLSRRLLGAPFALASMAPRRKVLDALRQKGMILIEADTDGVYFAVPSGWSEDAERALVAEIGAELPAGIRLEYEGRYRAMFSHEVKNYALLTYSGRLIVHGVALRSSRAEPFGERFLRRALLSTMTGDIVDLHAAYLETVNALRRQALPASELGARVRLSKTLKPTRLREPPILSHSMKHYWPPGAKSGSLANGCASTALATKPISGCQKRLKKRRWEAPGKLQHRWSVRIV